jgi:hypothetical protein
VKAPRELHPFHFLMACHPRLNAEPLHVWLLRGDAIHKSLQNLIPQRCHGKGRLPILNDLKRLGECSL